jgi:hypothetical protein
VAWREGETARVEDEMCSRSARARAGRGGTGFEGWNNVRERLEAGMSMHGGTPAKARERPGRDGQMCVGAGGVLGTRGCGLGTLMLAARARGSRGCEAVSVRAHSMVVGNRDLTPGLQTESRFISSE